MTVPRTMVTWAASVPGDRCQRGLPVARSKAATMPSVSPPPTRHWLAAEVTTTVLPDTTMWYARRSAKTLVSRQAVRPVAAFRAVRPEVSWVRTSPPATTGPTSAGPAIAGQSARTAGTFQRGRTLLTFDAFRTF